MLRSVKMYRVFPATLFVLLAISHIPSIVFPNYFDKNATANFVVLCLIAVLLSIVLLFRVFRFSDASWLPAIGFGLLLVMGWATINSGDITGSLIGDVGRFTGGISLVALGVAGYYHFSTVNGASLVRSYLWGVSLFQIVAYLDYFKIFDVPTAWGFAGTLGNLNFLSAFVGTSLPLYFLLLTNRTRLNKIHFGLALPMSLTSIVLAGAKQGYVDVLLFVCFGVLLLFKNKSGYVIKLRERSNNFVAGVLSAILAFWLQILLVVPFLGFFVPYVSDDVQVKIRGQYWSAALNMFADFPFFGVGPDQYGNYYEKYRVAQSVDLTERVLSNDAHSSVAQTLATLGIAGAIAFAALNFLVIKSWVIAMRSPDSPRPFLWIFLAYYFIYWTNSTISVITLPNKYLFWAFCGVIVGMAYRDKVSISNRVTLNRWIAITILIISLPLISWNGARFTQAQLEFASTYQRSMDNPKEVLSFKPNDYLPCSMYYFGLQQIYRQQTVKAQVEMAKEQLRIKPRCSFATLNLFTHYLVNRKYQEASKFVPLLIEQAPTRREVLVQLIIYAKAVGDEQLLARAFIQADKLGLTED